MQNTLVCRGAQDSAILQLHVNDAVRLPVEKVSLDHLEWAELKSEFGNLIVDENKFDKSVEVTSGVKTKSYQNILVRVMIKEQLVQVCTVFSNHA